MVAYERKLSPEAAEVWRSRWSGSDRQGPSGSGSFTRLELRGARPETVGFACNACGRCCDSAPELSLRELFRLEKVFLGRFSVRRVPRLAEGQLLLGGVRAGEQDVREAEALSALLLHRCPQFPEADFHLYLRGFSFGSLAKCPALESSGLCAIHEEGKPKTCQVSPLDAVLPDSLQGAYLSRRREESEAWGSGCLGQSNRQRPDSPPVSRARGRAESPLSGASAAASQESLRPLVHRLKVVSAEFNQSLAERRRDLALERELWGGAVFRLLLPELCRDASRLSSLPEESQLSLSLVFVLTCVAEVSTRCRERVIEFLKAQDHLYEYHAAESLFRRNHSDRRELLSLRKEQKILSGFRLHLEKLKGGPPMSERAFRLEQWIGAAG